MAHWLDDELLRLQEKRREGEEGTAVSVSAVLQDSLDLVEGQWLRSLNENSSCLREVNHSLDFALCRSAQQQAASKDSSNISSNHRQGVVALDAQCKAIMSQLEKGKSGGSDESKKVSSQLDGLVESTRLSVLLLQNVEKLLLDTWAARTTSRSTSGPTPTGLPEGLNKEIRIQMAFAGGTRALGEASSASATALSIYQATGQLNLYPINYNLLLLVASTVSAVVQRLCLVIASTNSASLLQGAGGGGNSPAVTEMTLEELEEVSENLPEDQIAECALLLQHLLRAYRGFVLECCAPLSNRKSGARRNPHFSWCAEPTDTIVSLLVTLPEAAQSDSLSPCKTTTQYERSLAIRRPSVFDALDDDDEADEGTLEDGVFLQLPDLYAQALQGLIKPLAYHFQAGKKKRASTSTSTFSIHHPEHYFSFVMELVETKVLPFISTLASAGHGVSASQSRSDVGPAMLRSLVRSLNAQFADLFLQDNSTGEVEARKDRDEAADDASFIHRVNATLHCIAQWTPMLDRCPSIGMAHSSLPPSDTTPFWAWLETPTALGRWMELERAYMLTAADSFSWRRSAIPDTADSLTQPRSEEEVEWEKKNWRTRVLDEGISEARRSQKIWSSRGKKRLTQSAAGGRPPTIVPGVQGTLRLLSTIAFRFDCLFTLLGQVASSPSIIPRVLLQELVLPPLVEWSTTLTSHVDQLLRHDVPSALQLDRGSVLSSLPTLIDQLCLAEASAHSLAQRGELLLDVLPLDRGHPGGEDEEDGAGGHRNSHTTRDSLNATIDTFHLLGNKIVSGISDLVCDKLLSTRLEDGGAAGSGSYKSKSAASLDALDNQDDDGHQVDASLCSFVSGTNLTLAELVLAQCQLHWGSRGNVHAEYLSAQVASTWEGMVEGMPSSGSSTLTNRVSLRSVLSRLNCRLLHAVVAGEEETATPIKTTGDVAVPTAPSDAEDEDAK